MFTVDDGIQRYEERTTATTSPEVFEPIEMDNMAMSQLVVESRLTEEPHKRMRIRFHHHKAYLDFNGVILFLMVLDVCNASVSFEIESAHGKLKELTVNDFPRKNLTEFRSTAQKYAKVVHSGYALPIWTGSKLLMKCTKNECEFFNKKAYTYLDLFKTMEDGFKLSDPKSMTVHRNYSSLGPV
jgi:hypothetical protein